MVMELKIMKIYKLTFESKKGFAMVMALVLLVAMASMSVAMLGLIEKSSKTTVSSSQNTTVIHAAEFAVEAGRLWLVDQLSLSGTEPITITNDENEAISGACLGLHGYTDNTQFIYYANKAANIRFGQETDTNFGRYNYTYYVQRIGHHSTLNGYNFIPQTTMGADGLVAGTKNSRRIFYRVIGCGYGPDPNYIVPMQGYFSAGGDDPSHETNANLDARSLKSEGYFKP